MYLAPLSLALFTPLSNSHTFEARTPPSASNCIGAMDLTCPSGSGSGEWTKTDCSASGTADSWYGVSIHGVTNKDSGVFGCQLNDDDVQWFLLDNSAPGASVYLCWIAGLDGSNKVTVINGDSDQYLGINMFYQEDGAPGGRTGDGKTFYSQGTQQKK
ncbi:hypothetical protein MNV49_004765 [Pseudohyphozyma bogoriensis]|nr:hypothetical protein MNV49_004765 [Pseudohyphozyma bogoriensis]